MHNGTMNMVMLVNNPLYWGFNKLAKALILGKQNNCGKGAAVFDQCESMLGKRIACCNDAILPIFQAHS